MEVKKILVKCPAGKDQVFMFFPFLIALSEEYPKAEINIISEEGESLGFAFLPFKVRGFERPKDKKTFLQTHHYCANMHDIFNIDLFFDLENSTNSAFLGFNFRCKERIGYINKWNKYFLTRKYEAVPNLSIEKQSINLLESFIGKKMSELKIQKLRENGREVEKVEKLFKEPEPPKFIMIMLNNFKSVASEIEIWKQFFDSFQNQKFIIWTLEDSSEISELFAKIDLGHNQLYMHEGNSSQELFYLFNKVKGIVTNNLWAEGLCTYLGLDCISLFSNSVSLPTYDYFRFKPQRMIFHAPNLIKHTYLEEEKEYFEINQIVDHIHFQFKL